jgi:hypothetical protein
MKLFFLAHKWVCLACFICILSLVNLFAPSMDNLQYKRSDATGYKLYQASVLYYYYDTIGYFPLFSVEKSRRFEQITFSETNAENSLNGNPLQLRTEIGHFVRFGELARIWALWPSRQFENKPSDLTLQPFNVILFSSTLILLFAGMALSFGLATAFLSVAFLSSSPFLISELFLKNNTLGLLALTLVLVASIALIVRKVQNYYWSVSLTIFASLVVGFLSEIRGEVILAFAPVVLYWLLLDAGKPLLRCVAIIVCCATLFVSKYGIVAHFDRLQLSANQMVLGKGGVPFEGGATVRHPIWHPILAGLGDFDSKYDFEWRDAVIFKKVMGDTPEIRSIIKRKTFYDPDTQFYYKRVETLPEYNSKARDLFFETVVKDPIWYLGILTKRVGHILYNTSPVKLNLAVFNVSLHYGIICLILLVFGFYKIRNLAWLIPDKLSVFMLLSTGVASLQPLFIYSGRGVTFASWLPLTLILVLTYQLLKSHGEQPVWGRLSYASNS